MAATLIVDAGRENAVTPFLAGTGVPYVVQRITTADYSVMWTDPANKSDERILAVFERKTWADFAASLGDGRLMNIDKMIDIQRRYPGCQIYYIIEGPAFPAPTTKYGKGPGAFQQSRLDSMLVSMNVVYGIQTVHTKDSQHTAVKLAEYTKKFSKKMVEIRHRYPTPPETALVAPAWSRELTALMRTIVDHPTMTEDQLAIMCGAPYAQAVVDLAAQNSGVSAVQALLAAGGPAADAFRAGVSQVETQWQAAGQPTRSAIQALTETKQRSMENIVINIWMVVRGVAINTAPILARAFTPKQLLLGQVPREALAAMKYESGAPFHKNLIHNLLNIDEATEVKMLKCIPNMGQKAEQLIKVGRLRGLVCLTPDQLSVIKLAQKGGEVSLGPARAKEILTAFDTKL